MSDTNASAFCCCDDWMSLSPALTTGSGTRTGAGAGTGAGLGGGSAATRWKFGGEKRLKSGKDNRSTLGKEICLKSSRGMPAKPGKELAAAAPMTTRAARDTAITGARLWANCGAASGCLSPCVLLSGASVTCGPYVSAQSRASSHRRAPKQAAIAVTNQQWLARWPTRIRLKSWARMVNDRLFPETGRPRYPSRARSVETVTADIAKRRRHVREVPAIRGPAVS